MRSKSAKIAARKPAKIPARKPGRATSAQAAAGTEKPTRLRMRQMALAKLGWPVATAPIVPRENISSQALTLVIAIMTFLVCATFGAVTMVSETASAWQSDIAREVTIQIRPLEGVDMEAALLSAKQIAEQNKGIARVEIVDVEATARLLEPWLGTGLSLDQLPIPRLISVRLKPGERPDLDKMRKKLLAEVPGASLDDHQAWAKRLTTMAGATVIAGIIVMAMMLLATVLTIIFATRGAMANNQPIVEVLHFIGAEDSFIARQFQQHFLRLGLKGGSFGGLLALTLFFAIGYWSSSNIATPGSDQMTALFGTFSVSASGYVGAIAIVILIAFLTAVTSRITVFRQLAMLDRNAK